MNSAVSNAAIIATLLNETPKPVVLLGAGASVKSGIPLAGEIVSLAAKWRYAREHGKDWTDPRLTRSDWYPWLVETQSWFRSDVPLASLFPYAVEHLLQPKKIRKDFWIKVLNPDTPISIGYHRIVELMHLKRINIVLTTNFDDCISKARNDIARPHFIDIVKTPSDYNKISATPTYPLLIYTHGAVENYTDKNVIEEVEKMDQGLVHNLIPILRDHPLVVVGYRGAEASIMNHLLINNAEDAHFYKNGIYWCLRKGESPDDLPDYVKLLSQTIGSNLQFVEIESFDHLFDKVVWAHLGEEKMRVDLPKLSIINATSYNEIKNFDMRVTLGSSIEDLEMSLLKVRVGKYCEKLNISIPIKVEESWLQQQMQHLSLIKVGNGEEVHVTNAGVLLFGKNPQKFITGVKTIVRFIGNQQWLTSIFDNETFSENIYEKEITGNLWTQINELSSALALVNRPFRLKNEKSENVLPYDSIALKEITVNSLVHRNYEDDSPNIVEIYADRIIIKNPGGLIDEVKSYFESESLFEEVRKGRRGIKGYRNPVIADLFYSSGDMDKKGSGLYDVVHRVKVNAGYVELGPNIDNTEFHVTIWCRPEAVDLVTNTASPLNVTATKFSSNIIEISHIPKTVFFAPSLYKKVKEMFEYYPGISFPPFIFHENNIYTFTDLRKGNNPLRNLIDLKSLQLYALDEFLETKDGDKKMIWLLNDYVKRHLKEQGLIVDYEKNRAYFPKTENGERVITYQARFKKATRTLVKPRYAQDKERIRYWEHKAFNFSVKKLGNEWGVMIEPTYVFTLNGEKVLFSPKRVGALATKKASRDYNVNVLNDIVFWLYVLANGATGAFRLTASSDYRLDDDVILSTEYLSASINHVEYRDDFSTFDLLDVNSDDIDEEIAKIADLEIQLAANKNLTEAEKGEDDEYRFK